MSDHLTALTHPHGHASHTFHAHKTDRQTDRQAARCIHGRACVYGCRLKQQSEKVREQLEAVNRDKDKKIKR